MQKYFLVALMLPVFFSCNLPNEIKVPDDAKHADKYSRQFISFIVDGQPDSSLKMMNPEAVDDGMTEFIRNAGININKAKINKIRVVEFRSSTGYFPKTEKFTNYKISYEYEFDKGNILFFTTLREKDKEIFLTGFDGHFLTAPLTEQTAFTFLDKSIWHYLFLTLCILIPIFILATLLYMLLSKMSIKKKIIWTLIIMFISLPKFIINWNTGEMDFQLINFSLLGSGFSRPNLYTAWYLTFSLPLGAIIYWIKRKSLQPEVKYPEDDNIAGANPHSSPTFTTAAVQKDKSQQPQPL